MSSLVCVAVPVLAAGHNPASGVTPKVLSDDAEPPRGARAGEIIHLEWRPATQSILPGETANLGLYAVSGGAEAYELSGIELIFAWEPADLELLGLDGTGEPPTWVSTFPYPCGCDLNEVDGGPPQDGDGFYIWLPPPMPEVWATTNGTLVTTFQFEGVVGTDVPTDVELLASIIVGENECESAVASGYNSHALGELRAATVTVLIPCTGDEDCDDDNDCTDDACVEQRCQHSNNSSPCDDDVFCNGADTCSGGSCSAHAGDPCAVDEWCDESANQCVEYGNGDFNGDLDVDLVDFAAFQTCFGQLGVGYCVAGNMVGTDGVIDLADLASFVAQLEASGPQ